MVANLPFSCRCGQVSGELIQPSPANGDHIVCHCGDCQNFARHLGSEDRVLGPFGGTDLYQGRCAAFRFITGHDDLACIHLTEKPTLRWYASCCNTPMFNTYANSRMPYVTALLANCDNAMVAELLGPPIGHLSLPKNLPDGCNLPRMSFAKLFRRFFGRMIRDMVTGDRRRSQLFDPQTLNPIATPRRLKD
jgi:hypothetical protein